MCVFITCPILPDFKSTVCTRIHIKSLLMCLRTSNYFWCVCVHQITLITEYDLILHFDNYHKYSTITIQYARKLLLLQNFLKYYYYHTICYGFVGVCSRRLYPWGHICGWTYTVVVSSDCCYSSARGGKRSRGEVLVEPSPLGKSVLVMSKDCSRKYSNRKQKHKMCIHKI